MIGFAIRQLFREPFPSIAMSSKRAKSRADRPHKPLKGAPVAGGPSLGARTLVHPSPRFGDD